MQQPVRFKPFFNNVLVTLEDAPDVIDGSEAGLVAPEIAKERPQHGTVVAVGFQAINTKVGDKILFAKYSGKPIEVDGVKYLYMKEAEIVGTFLNTELTADEEKTYSMGG